MWHQPSRRAVFLAESSKKSVVSFVLRRYQTKGTAAGMGAVCPFRCSLTDRTTPHFVKSTRRRIIVTDGPIVLSLPARLRFGFRQSPIHPFMIR